MNFKTHAQRGRALIAGLAGVIAFAVLVIGFDIQPQTANAPQESTAARPSLTPPPGDRLPEVEASADAGGNVFEYN